MIFVFVLELVRNLKKRMGEYEVIQQEHPTF